MAIIITKDNAFDEMKDNLSKLSEKIKESDVLNGMMKESTRFTEMIKESDVLNGMMKESTRLNVTIKESEVLNEMMKESTRLTEKIKESEVLNEMIKESTLDKLLVGKGTLDGLLVEEVKEWQYEREPNAIETVHEDCIEEHRQAAKDRHGRKMNGTIGHKLVESGVVNAVGHRSMGVMNSIHSIVQGRYSKSLAPINAEEKENIAPIPTPENEHLTKDSHTNNTGGSHILAQYFSPEKLGQLGDFASDIVEAMGDMVKDPLARNVEIPYAQQHLARKTEGQWTLASNRGWNSVTCGGESPSQVVESGLGVGDYERNLILELYPSGTKVEPPVDKLEALLDELEEGNPWILRAKALCVIETVLNLEAERKAECCGDEPFVDFFRRCSERIEPLANHPRESVSLPAKRVMVALGLNVAASPQLLVDEADAHPMAAVAAAAALPSFHTVASSVTSAGLTGSSLLSELNTKAFSSVHNLQKAYQENKEKRQFQQTTVKTRGMINVPTFSSWNPIPARSTIHEKLLDAL
jgi:hypothetical protein